MQARIRRLPGRRKKQYIEIPRRGRWQTFLAGLLLAGTLAASLWGVAAIDRNSSLVGWNRRPTEFAVALTPGWDRLSLTVYGQRVEIPLGQAGRVRGAVTLAARAVPYSRPAMWRETVLLLREGARHTHFVRQAFATLRGQTASG